MKEQEQIKKVTEKMESLYSSTSWTSPDGKVSRNYKIESTPSVELVDDAIVVTIPFCQLRDKKHVQQRENIIDEAKSIIKSLGMDIESERCEILGKVDHPVWSRLENRDNVQYVLVINQK